MRYRTVLVVALAMAGTISEKASAQSGPLCPGLTGAARTSCLQEENRKAADAVAVADARVARLNAQMKTACDMMDAANQVAMAAAKSRKDQRVAAAGLTFATVTHAMAYVTKTKQGCEEARQAVSGARR